MSEPHTPQDSVSAECFEVVAVIQRNGDSSALEITYAVFLF